MALFRQAILIAATLGVATGGAYLFRALHLPLAAILGSLCGATIVSNIFGGMDRAHRPADRPAFRPPGRDG